MKQSVESDTPGLLRNRACRNCVQIKVKCIPLQSSPNKICQRCDRLGKNCTTPAPASRKQRTKSTRVTQLEERIDQLSSLLTPSRVPPETQILPHQGSISTDKSTDKQANSVDEDEEEEDRALGSRSSECKATNCAHKTGEDRQRCAWASGQQPIARSGSPSIFMPHLPGRKDGSQLRTEHFCPVYLEAELEKKLFREFRNYMAKEFPFVTMKPSTSATVLKDQKPFLYWACLTVASHRDVRLQRNLHDEMMKAVGHRMLVAGGKSIDLLQGILVLIAWSHNISHYTAQFMNLLHLAQALLADLGISKPIRMQDKIRIANDTTAMMHGTESMSLEISNDDRRALLGCYCISSKAAMTFNRIDPMRYSQHISDCCDTLKSASEYSSDTVLVELVQLYHIFGKYLQVDQGSNSASTSYRSIFQEELKRYRHGLPKHLQNNTKLQVEVVSGSLYFLEPSYTNDCRDKIGYLNAFNACVDSGNELVQLLTSISCQDWPSTTFMIAMSLLQLLIVLSRLSFFKPNDCGIEQPWRMVNLSAILQQLEELQEKIHQHETVEHTDYAPWRFAIHARKTRHIRTWYEAKVAAEEAALTSNAHDMMPNTFSENMFGDFDDSMWQDLMGNWADF